MLKVYRSLSKSLKIPKIYFRARENVIGDDVYNLVTLALKNRCIHTDVANGYANEKSVDKTINDSKIPREKIFVTSKLPSHIKNYKDEKIIFEETLKILDLNTLIYI